MRRCLRAAVRKAEMGIIVNSLQQQRVRIVTNAEK